MATPKSPGITVTELEVHERKPDSFVSISTDGGHTWFGGIDPAQTVDQHVETVLERKPRIAIVGSAATTAAMQVLLMEQAMLRDHDVVVIDSIPDPVERDIPPVPRLNDFDQYVLRRQSYVPPRRPSMFEGYFLNEREPIRLGGGKKKDRTACPDKKAKRKAQGKARRRNRR